MHCILLIYGSVAMIGTLVGWLVMHPPPACSTMWVYLQRVYHYALAHQQAQPLLSQIS